MGRRKHGVRRFAVFIVGCSAAGLVIGWSCAERPPVAGVYSRTLGR